MTSFREAGLDVEGLYRRIVDLETRELEMTATIAALRESEARARAMAEHAESFNRMQADVLANLSHELRTPLNAIMGFAEMIRDEIVGPVGNDRYRAYAADIHDSALHLLKVIESLLNVSKGVIGKIVLAESEVALPAVIETARRMIQPRADRAGLGITIQLPPDLPAVRADARKLCQILLNLLSNAVKFTPPGGTVMVTAGRCVDGGLAIRVCDTGIGMRREDIPRALQPFIRLQEGLERDGDGAGLGLPLCEALMKAHDGRMEVDSEPGRGTTVTLFLPPGRVISAAG